MAFSFSNQKEVSIAIIVIVILIMIFKPSILGIMYNNIIGKLFLVACIVFLTLKHTIAGLLGVVFIAVIASNSVFEGNQNADDDNADETKNKKKPNAEPATTMSGETASEDKKEESTPTNVNIEAAKAALNVIG
jgi:hypothetical protein